MFENDRQGLNSNFPVTERISHPACGFCLGLSRLQLKIVVAVLLFTIFAPGARAAENAPPAAPVKADARWSFYRQYVPEKREYNLEVGAMWEKQDLYWLGADIGFHMGRCVFSWSESCQHYLDIAGGAGGRDGLTTGMLLFGWRWQFIHFPNAVSPHLGLWAGSMNIRGMGRDETVFASAIDYGLTAPVHERLDLKCTLRVGHAATLWSQVFVSLSFKMDRIVDFYVQKMKSFGESAVDVTGAAIKGTISAPGKIKDWITNDGDKTKSQNSSPDKSQ